MKSPFGDLFKFSAFDEAKLKQSGEIWMKGVQEMHESTLSKTKSRFDAAIDYWNSLFALKTFDDLYKLQTEYNRSLVENSVADAQEAAGSLKSLVEKTVSPLKPTDTP